MFPPSDYRAGIIALIAFVWIRETAAQAYFRTRTLTFVRQQTTLRMSSPIRDVAVKVGETATVFCGVDPDRPPDTTFRWGRIDTYFRPLSDSLNVSGSSTDTLRLHNMSRILAARYQCSFSSKVHPGMAHSRQVLVTVKDVDSLELSPPLLRWPSEGADTSVAVFRCKAEKPPLARLPAIKWQVFSRRRWIAISKAAIAAKFVIFQNRYTDTSTLQIFRPSREDVFLRYRCRVGQLTSQPGHLHLFAGPPTVMYPTPFLQSLQDVTVTAGYPIVLPCATLYRDGEVSWGRRNGTYMDRLAHGDRVFSSKMSIVGVSNLKIHSASIEMAGMYVCSVQVGGRVFEAQAMLTVHQAPKLLDKRWDSFFINASVIANVDRTFNITCVFSSWPPPKIQFTKGDIDLPPVFYEVSTKGGPLSPSLGQATFSRRPVITTASLIFPSNLSMAAVQGTYMCRAYSVAGQDLALRRVDPLYPVRIVRQPPPVVTVPRHHSILLPCDSDGIPTATVVSWFHNETCVAANSKLARTVDIPRLERYRFRLTETGSLNISNARHSDSGFYTCSVSQVEYSNEAKRSRPSFLTVTGDHSGPVIDGSRLPNITILHARDPFQLYCATSGFPEPKVEWRYLGEGTCPPLEMLREEFARKPRKLTPFEKLLIEKGVGSLTPFQDDGEGMLSFRSARPSHIGRYACVAHSSLGVARHCVHITLEDAPVITDPTLDMVDTLRDVLRYVVKELRVHCGASGSPTPRVRWTWAIVRQNGSLASSGATPWGKGRIMHSLKLPADTLYVNKTCYAENKFGEMQRALRFMFKKQPLATEPKPTEQGTSKHSPTASTTNIPETKPSLVKESQDSENAKVVSGDDTAKIYMGLTVVAALVLIMVLVVIAVGVRRMRASEEEQHVNEEECADSANSKEGTVRPECKRQSSISSSGDREQSTATTLTVCPDSVSVQSNVLQRPTLLWPASGATTPGPPTPVLLGTPTPRTPMHIVPEAPAPAAPAPAASPARAVPVAAAPPASPAARIRQEFDPTRSPVPVSHKRSSFFDFNASCNQIPEGEAEGDAATHLEPAHAKQPSSSWGGTTSPLETAVLEDQQDYEEMQPPAPVQLCSPAGDIGSLATSPPLPPKSSSLPRQCHGSCPSVATNMEPR